MKTTPLLLLAALAMASACTRPNDLGLAPLDQPAIVVAQGVHRQSSVSVYRQGTLDAPGGLVTVNIHDAALRLDAGMERSTIEQLVLALDDSDLPPSTAAPSGIRLRKQQLTITAPVAAQMMARDRDGLTVRAHGTLAYDAAMVLDDGTLYQLGRVQSEPGDLELRATRYEFGVYVTIDAAPRGTCLSIPGLLELTNCSLYVESDGSSTGQ